MFPPTQAQGSASSSEPSSTRDKDKNEMDGMVPNWKEYSERVLKNHEKIACNPCRKRKQRCDRARPKCHECMLFGRECGFYEDSTGMVALVCRLKDLENRLEEHRKKKLSTRSAALVTPRPSIVVDNMECDISAMRPFFLKHRARLGVCFTEKRFAAVHRGDTSAVHPALVYAGQLAGCMFHFNERERFDPHPAESLQLRRTIESLNLALDAGSLDVLTALQVTQLLSKYFFYRNDSYAAREYVLKAAHIALKYDLHLLPVLRDKDPAATFTETSGRVLSLRIEEIGILCQLLYTDMSQRLIFGRTTLFPDYLHAELSQLYDGYDLLCTDSYLFAARANCVTYFVASHDLAARSRTDACCDKVTDTWSTSYYALLHKTRRELAYLQTRMQEVRNQNDADTARGLLTAIFLAFATLIKLYSLTAPSLPDSRKMLLRIVIQVAQITRSLKEEDFSKMCPTTVFAWIYCARAIQKEFGAADTPLSTNDLTAMLRLITHSVMVLDRKMPSFRIKLLLSDFSTKDAPSLVR
ncbi:hypothetical protein CYLTODRAFT_490662 [Cylindrobasidium torrendii FP15055 ss-10]|uniref:Zn(2)-C6 fungal-type domain-containing protein n=1 Tax=Cylindrobasidium torrendii FP15055 ss-10 TaxID=1314674 RepID=A0A0D7BAX1_9AGAR|nr:hypothetical protein CYLTODRAFT_490662 [Cylindrobasidium torrendii FP15055 ss-10]